MKTITERLAEKHELSIGYQTKDFEFVVACMSLKTHDIRVLALTPSSQIGRGGKTDQVDMHLAIFRGGKSVDDVRGEFDALRIAYQNREFRVDPRDLFENQRTMRSAMLDTVKRRAAAQARLDEAKAAVAATPTTV